MPYKNIELPTYPVLSDMWDALQREERPIVVYGMGNGADKLFSRLEKYGVRVSDIFASDGFVRGHSYHGMRVKSFSEIKEEYSDFVILLSFASNREEVLSMLSEINDNYDMLIPDMPVCAESEYFDREFYNKNYAQILKAYECLEDEASRRSFASVINYKLTGKMQYLLDATCDKNELYSTLTADAVRRIIDVGAYNGDTLLEAKEYFRSLEAALCIEPDPKTYKKLLRAAERLEGVEVKCINAAAWDSEGKTSFLSGANRNSSVSSTASFEHKTVAVPLVSVDSLSFNADYIKYDVEGAEYEALLGSAKTIESCRPQLLVSLYHRSADIFSLVNMLKEKYPFYKAYIRRLRCVPAWELDLILIPT